MHPKELEQLKQLVKASPLLSDPERLEWLELLPMMNDKQLTELQGILSSSQPPPAAAPQKSPVPATLPHIANLPTKLQFDLGPIPKARPPAERPYTPPPAGPVPPVTVRPLGQDFAKRLRRTVEEKELPAPAAPRTPPPAAASAPQLSKAETTAVLNSLEDVARLEPQSFRRIGAAHLIDELRTFMKKTDYFEILFAFEKSPLYKAYLQSGKQALHNEGFKGQQTVLTKEEFEQLTDVLRQIQVSK